MQYSVFLDSVFVLCSFSSCLSRVIANHFYCQMRIEWVRLRQAKWMDTAFESTLDDLRDLNPTILSSKDARFCERNSHFALVQRESLHNSSHLETTEKRTQWYGAIRYLPIILLPKRIYLIFTLVKTLRAQKQLGCLLTNPGFIGL